MIELNIDLETYSENDIKLGVHKYAQAVEVLLFAYSYNKGPVQVVDLLHGEEIPDYIVKAIFDPKVIKRAWNAAFEITVLSKHFGRPLDAMEWRCTMVKAARAGYPLSLGDAAKALNLEQQKDTRGKALIKKFCEPKRASAKHPGLRNYPTDSLDLWEDWLVFKEYARQDVVTEMAIDVQLSVLPPFPMFEECMYALDRRINERGIELDIPYIKKIIEIDHQYKTRLTKEAADFSGLENPNSLMQLKEWFEDRGLFYDSLDKDALSLFMEEYKDSTNQMDQEIYKMLEFRKELSNTSVRKYIKMIEAEVNGRIHDTIQFNGAARTGRNAGRLIQPQNLPRIYMGDAELDQAKKDVINMDLQELEAKYDSIASLTSQLIRTALIAKEGYILRAVDLSSIEARIVAWLANEKYDLEVSRTHGRIYEATASIMFKTPIEEITKGSPLRQRGKVASLACGYQGGVNAITAMDVDRAIPDKDKPGLVKAWRETHPATVKYWRDIENAAKKAIKNPNQKVTITRGSYFIFTKGHLLMFLPSGRYLSYPGAHLAEKQTSFGTAEEIRYFGIDQYTNKWKRLSTYGGKLLENQTQAIARDVLMIAMYNFDKAGYNIVTNVHDEIVTEDPIGFGSLEELEKLMCTMPSWADELPLGAEGFESKYYKK